MEQERSLGHKRTVLSFNPSGNPLVTKLKTIQTEFINVCDEMRQLHKTNGEYQRVLALAMTDAESAAMWSVKAATMDVTSSQ
jgi:hypothetical protein